MATSCFRRTLPLSVDWSAGGPRLLVCLCRRKIWPRSRFESDTGCEETSVWSTCELLKKGQSVSDMEKATFLFPHTLEDTATTTSSSAPASSARRQQPGPCPSAATASWPGRAGWFHLGAPAPACPTRGECAREHPTAIPHQDARPRRGALVMSDRRTAPRTRRARSGTSPTMPASRAGDVRHQGARGGGGERIPGARRLSGEPRRRPQGRPGRTVLEMPSVHPWSSYPPAVGLVSYGPDLATTQSFLSLVRQARPCGSWMPLTRGF